MAINRNPDSMRNCAANIEKSVGLIEDAILDTTRALEIYADDLDYKTTAKVFETTYANVFNWVKKYKEKGEDGLGDNRGRHKTNEEVDETELLRRQLNNQ